MKNIRKKKYIDSAVQGAMARRIIQHWLTFFAVLFVLLPLWRLIQTGSLSAPFSTMIIESWKETLPVLLILAAMIPIFVWDTIKLSHRFAGPMYRFQKTIQSLAAGEEVAPIRLRKGDFWHNVADDFNAMLQRVNARADAEPEDEVPVAAGVGEESV